MKMRLLQFMAAAGAALCMLATSCAKDKTSPTPTPEEEDVQTPHEKYFDGKYYHDIPNDGWEKEVKERADVLLMEWTPLKDVAGSFLKPGLYFTAGNTVSGVPYSSVKPYTCYLGRDVSFYTFLSSVHNPKSLLYTTDYRTPEQYKSTSTYYGNTCTGGAIFCWGLKFSYSSGAVYNNLVPGISQRKTDDLSKIQLFDMVVYWVDDETGGGGHAMMIYDIARDSAGTIRELTVYESAHPTNRITKYTVEEYRKRLDQVEKNGEGKSYFFHYDHENYASKYQLPPYLENRLSEVESNFPEALCVNRGDKVSYSEGSSVTINILSGEYSEIELYKDGSFYKSQALAGTDDVVFENLPAGLYEACLSNGASKSDRTSFEIGAGTFTVSYDGSSITIRDVVNIPLCITINSGESIYEFPLIETSAGVWKYTGGIGQATHARVHYAGKYGRYSGKSIRFRN